LKSWKAAYEKSSPCMILASQADSVLASCGIDHVSFHSPCLSQLYLASLSPEEPEAVCWGGQSKTLGRSRKTYHILLPRASRQQPRTELFRGGSLTFMDFLDILIILLYPGYIKEGNEDYKDSLTTWQWKFMPCSNFIQGVRKSEPHRQFEWSVEDKNSYLLMTSHPMCHAHWMYSIIRPALNICNGNKDQGFLKNTLWPNAHFRETYLKCPVWAGLLSIRMNSFLFLCQSHNWELT
jgi:hypothetical protein